jgi:hypothetical protein
MGRKRSPRALAGTGAGNLPPRGDGDGSPFPDGDFPVAIPTPASHFCPSIRRPHGSINYSRNPTRCLPPPPMIPRVPDHGCRSHPHRSGQRAFRFGNLTSPIHPIIESSPPSPSTKIGRYLPRRPRHRRCRQPPHHRRRGQDQMSSPRPVAASVISMKTGCPHRPDPTTPISPGLPLQPLHPHHLDGGWVVASRMGS